jgi:hypothetical protein
MKLLNMSINTIKWGCLYSGVGITYSSPDKELGKLLLNIDSDNSPNNIYQNFIPLKCIYKKGKPEFKSISSEMSKPINYAWIPKSFTKVISPSTQSYTILALCNLAEHIYNEDLLLGNILVKNAEMLYDFLSTYLRNEDGLFISVDDKTKSFSEDIKIKSHQKDSKLIDQLCVFEALLCLNYITSKNEFMEYFNPQNSKYLNEARSIFNYIYENYHDFLELTSKQISLSISTLVRCCKYEKDTEQQVNYCQLIALFCAELESRIKVTGELERSFNNSEVSSFITHFRAASALLEGSMETGIKKFESLSIRIYDYLTDLFDYSMGLFVTGDSTELNYSIRDIAEIIKGLFVYYSASKKDRILKIIIDFYTSAIEKSGIVPSIAERDCKFKGRDMHMPEELLLMSECNKTPVFLKSFRFVFKKTQVFTTSKYFNSNYAFYSSYLFLMYLTPIIDIK